MSKISLSTNVDLQNYARRVDDVATAMKPLGIEIFSLPQNYANKIQLDLPEKKTVLNGFPVLSREMAKEIGKEFRRNGIRRIQFHYPWQKTLLDMNGHDIALTYNFCDIVLEESGAEKLTINHHNSYKYPTPSMARELDSEYRWELLDMLAKQTALAKRIGKKTCTQCLLIVENNPATSVDTDKKTGEGILDVFDLVPEDYIGRPGLDGTTLDYSHAWSVVGYFKCDFSKPHEKPGENLEWCRRQYAGIPHAARSMKSFVEEVAPRVEWLHIGDEPDAFSHDGRHIGEGDINFKGCAELLEEFLTKDTPATIEVKDGHTDAGFKRILEHDYPVLKELFG